MPDTEDKKPVGRPLKFQSVEELQEKIDAYFDLCDKGEYVNKEGVEEGKEIKVFRTIPYSITGLALALGTSRQTLCNYAEIEEFIDSIEGARLRCENHVEIGSLRGTIPASIGAFILKNYEWKDKSEVENTGEQRMLVLNAHKKREVDDD